MDAYDLKSIQLPQLQGRGIKLFAAALERAATRPLFLGQLLRNGGIVRLREMRLDEPPTVFPTGRPSSSVGDNSGIDLSAFEKQPTIINHNSPFSSIYDYAHAYRTGVTTPDAVAADVIDAMVESDKGERPLKAFSEFSAEDILTQAVASTMRFQSGNPVSIFDGVPVAIKDELDQVPYPTSAGTSFLGNTPASADSTVVARLRKAGALLIGKTNMYEIGIIPEGFNPHYGTVRNPYELEHHSGGSSGGSAAAVAAGFCPVAVGADGGGSIRIPASYCGLVGLKPSYGRVCMAGGAPLCWTVDHYGPIGATVADVALTYAVIAGADDREAATGGQPPPTLADWTNSDLEGFRLGIYRQWFDHAAPEIVTASNQMLDRLVEAGAELVEIAIPDLDGMRIAQVVTILSEMASSMENLKANWGDFGAPTRINLALGRSFTSFDYIQAQRMRTRAISIFEELFTRVDAIATPATAITAPVIPSGGLDSGWSDLGSVTEAMRYVFPANLTGLPAITFPVGYNSSGLPIGMQVMGRRWHEQELLRIANVAEQNLERVLPALHFRILP